MWLISTWFPSFLHWWLCLLCIPFVCHPANNIHQHSLSSIHLQLKDASNRFLIHNLQTRKQYCTTHLLPQIRRQFTCSCRTCYPLDLSKSFCNFFKVKFPLKAYSTVVWKIFTITLEAVQNWNKKTCNDLIQRMRFDNFQVQSLMAGFSHLMFGQCKQNKLRDQQISILMV